MISGTSMPPVLVYAARPFLLEGEFFWSRAMTTVFEKTRRHPEFGSSGKAFFHDPMILPAVGEVDVVDDFEHSAVGHDETSHMVIPPGRPNCPGGVAKNFMISLTRKDNFYVQAKIFKA
jgi:hypothetical protein